MEKSITRHIKYTCINYIFFALHLTKGQERTPPYIHTDYPPKKDNIRREFYLSPSIFFF